MSAKGRCVICNSIGTLTFDHVPPQGVGPAQYIELSRLLPLVPEHPEKQSRRSYGNPQFPTICRICNGDRLGSQYDPHLIRFAQKFRTWVNASFKLGIALSSDFTIELQPHRVARSVVGHLLAAEERRDRTAALNNSEVSQSLRSYFLDTEAAFPMGAQIFVWPYPSESIVISRWFGLANPWRHGAIIGHVLKFFPLAFWLVTKTQQELEFTLARLPLHSTTSIDETATLTIPLNLVPALSWPEMPGDEEIVFTDAARTLLGRPSSNPKKKL
jgi:hypothetical protein